MKKFFLLATMVLVFSGCAWQEPYIIAQPPGPSAVVVTPAAPPVVVQPEKPTVVQPQGQPPSVPEPPQVKVWRPDPTRLLVCNDSRTLHLEVWIDSGPPASRMLRLIPELCGDVYVMIGDHFWYAQGYIETPVFGRVSVGTARRNFYIRNWSYSGGYVLRIPINDGDFGR